MGTGKRRCNLVIYSAVGLATALIHADNRLTDTHPTLGAGRVAAVAVQCPGCVRFIKPEWGLSDIME